MASLFNQDDAAAAAVVIVVDAIATHPTNSNINCPNKFSDVTPTYYDILSLERIQNHDNDDNFNGNFLPPKTQLQFNTINVGNGLANNRMAHTDRWDSGAANANVSDVETSAEAPTTTMTTLGSCVDTNGANKLGGPTFACENVKHFQMTDDASALTTIGQIFQTVDRQQSNVTAVGQHRIAAIVSDLPTPDTFIDGESKYWMSPGCSLTPFV
jgi:phage baseplate assembly protein gpV